MYELTLHGEYTRLYNAAGRLLFGMENEEEEDVTAVPAKARLISQLSNQATVQTKQEAGMGVIEDMYKARTRFNNYCVKKKCLQRVHE